eukprot:NODE_15889_length_223_cov_3.773810.p1 GENE.NODE_15889_length_223_cov_3.773810~~NODE_15889_length_223_cov_3.773810.p1  ORF type:complete len:67 (-),score=5.46 NODE_15889_length_223_cov_3.773810:23-193(-)
MPARAAISYCVAAQGARVMALSLQSVPGGHLAAFHMFHMMMKNCLPGSHLTMKHSE